MPTTLSSKIASEDADDNDDLDEVSIHFYSTRLFYNMNLCVDVKFHIYFTLYFYK